FVANHLVICTASAVLIYKETSLLAAAVFLEDEADPVSFDAILHFEGDARGLPIYASQIAINGYEGDDPSVLAILVIREACGLRVYHLTNNDAGDSYCLLCIAIIPVDRSFYVGPLIIDSHHMAITWTENSRDDLPSGCNFVSTSVKSARIPLDVVANPPGETPADTIYVAGPGSCLLHVDWAIYTTTGAFLFGQTYSKLLLGLLPDRMRCDLDGLPGDVHSLFGQGHPGLYGWPVLKRPQLPVTLPKYGSAAPSQPANHEGRSAVKEDPHLATANHSNRVLRQASRSASNKDFGAQGDDSKRLEPITGSESSVSESDGSDDRTSEYGTSSAVP
ncbi:hypothetical protein CALCODRAFT_542119, partial [Calocera cornea HHB12733]